MQSLRRAVFHFSRRGGSALAIACVVCIGGLALRAAHDWHRHGELGAKYFHLHFHVGDHAHGDHDHQHPDRDEQPSPTEGPRKRGAVLTVVQAIQDSVPAAPIVASLASTPDRKSIETVDLPRPAELSTSANPRAPPA